MASLWNAGVSFDQGERKNVGCEKCIALSLALLITLGCQQPTTISGPPRGGEKILPAAETAIAVVVGRIENRDKIDSHGYASQLSVRHSLLATTPPSPVRIAWEELATSRKPRFEVGDIVLVALSSLPNASLWDQRFPGARAASGVLAVAAAGDAYMHDPDTESLDLLERYLRLAAEQRDKAQGVEILAQMVASAASGVAASAVQRLATVAELEKIPAESLGSLGAALNDEQRPPALCRAVIDLIGARKVRALRPQIDVLAEHNSPLQAPALAAIAAMDGGLSAQRAAELLSSGDPAVRALAARYAAGPEIDSRLVRLIKDDPAPEVRGAAATALVEKKGLDAFDEVVPALADGNAIVRLAAVAAIGKLGGTAVPALNALARKGSIDEATGAVLALDQCGAAGKTVLIDLAADHPDERVRRLAMLALGKLGGHEH